MSTNTAHGGIPQREPKRAEGSPQGLKTVSIREAAEGDPSSVDAALRGVRGGSTVFQKVAVDGGSGWAPGSEKQQRWPMNKPRWTDGDQYYTQFMRTEYGNRRLGPKLRNARDKPRWSDINPAMYPAQMLEQNRWALIGSEEMRSFAEVAPNDYIGDFAFRTGDETAAWVIGTDVKEDARCALDELMDQYDLDILGAEYGYMDSVTIFCRSTMGSRRQTITIEGPLYIECRLLADGQWVRCTGEPFA